MGPTAFATRDPLPPDGEPRLPRPSRLQARLTLPGEKAQKAGERLGIDTVGGLLEHIPRDRRAARAIGELVEGETATVVVEVRSIKSRPVRRRGMKPLVEARVADSTGTMGVTFFNQPWLERRYRPGTRLLLTGKYQGRRGFRVNEHAETGELVATGEDMATYPASEGLTSVQIAALVHEHRDDIRNVPEPLPARLRARERLPDRQAALDAAHFGDQEGGRRRLAFDEFLLLQIALLRRRARRRESARAEPLAPPGELTARWLEHSLPFAPTGDQRRAMEAVDADIGADRPMQRLLMGEVGSCKTVVALYAMLRAVESGAQAALMAPTETLAEQHFATLQKLMPGSLVSVALLTGSTPAARRREILALAREHRAAARETLEPLPARLRVLERLPDRAAALDAAHFGDHEGGRRRLAFEELLLLQVALLRRRALRREGARAEPLEPPGELTRRWLADSLPFTPTDDQRHAMETADADLAGDRPMQRLLMGEVGSGKTVVALYAMLRAVEGGAQAALMAPTETLAEQHFATLQALMPGESVRAALLTGSTPAARRTDIVAKLSTGELSFVVGTHALVEPDVHFDRLAV
ncbi:MAG TPA: DEAD/DEAH box helicase, partial [Solirubrobacter sp.]|nr:DEAD/DEAH box helicase [Solirubrobacter sp.]